MSIYNKNYRRFGPTIKKMNNLKKRSPPPLPHVPGKESTSPDPKTTPEVRFENMMKRQTKNNVNLIAEP